MTEAPAAVGVRTSIIFFLLLRWFALLRGRNIRWPLMKMGAKHEPFNKQRELKFSSVSGREGEREQKQARTTKQRTITRSEKECGGEYIRK